MFGGNTLDLSEDIPASRATGSAQRADGQALFKPRRLGPSKPKAGLGFKQSNPNVVGRSDANQSAVASSSGGKGQDDFRKMLEKK